MRPFFCGRIQSSFEDTFKVLLRDTFNVSVQEDCKFLLSLQN